jgi:hypothetical protein
MESIDSLLTLKDMLKKYIEKKTLEEHEQVDLSLLIESEFLKINEEVLNELGISKGDYKSLANYYYKHFLEQRVYPLLFTHNIMTLPKRRGTSEDIHTYLQSLFNEYKDLINRLENTFVFSLNITMQIETLCNAILNSIIDYYSGHPSKAFNKLAESLSSLEEEGNLLLSSAQNIPHYLYRMRKTEGTNTAYESDQMFHIPFNLRHLIATQRYSIPGLPCLYLGGSAYICWEELERPLLEQTQTSIISKIDDNLKVLDFGYRPSDYYERWSSMICNRTNGHLTSDELEQMKSYLISWPLIAASSIQVNFRNGSFKPEYIIPQLLLQWITTKPEYDGIRYFSVKEHAQENSLHLIHNYVFPVKSHDQKEGYCSSLLRSFAISSGVPWQLFKLLPNEVTGPSSGQFKLMDNSEYFFYNLTEFGLLESYLYTKAYCKGDLICIGRLSDSVIENRENFFNTNKELIESKLNSALSIHMQYNNPNKAKIISWKCEFFDDHFKLDLTAIGSPENIKQLNIHPLHFANERISKELDLALGYKIINYERCFE